MEDTYAYLEVEKRRETDDSTEEVLADGVMSYLWLKGMRFKVI